MSIFSKLIFFTCLTAISPFALASPFISGGLGMPYHELISKYGPKETYCPSSSPYYNYPCLQSGLILLTDETNKGNTEEIGIFWPTEINTDHARILVTSYFPKDWKIVRTYKIKYSGRVVDLYYSPSLAKRFGKNKWNGEKPGTFTAAHSPDKRFVLISIGNNP
ncbi:hypothetical protein KIF53_22055 [Chromobacterium subtsugae]|uniref:Uncharacterized protein n=1 Tax=Chromobacterium subtsugae TaxID=251747 RepID=A0ABS7FJV2_9NEIS|nr:MULTISPECIES: hypothetical protein [Chromobacterium]MBW7568670.1 hypothetical protein [Chromobacterium subtsugae]MBW8290324.1 hypothetical protein [Chromobacterium subtsugae]WSE93652.1 hypothetical protein U6115_10560 [Chromobacterium subtsugae]WVH62029.1 hypothetical protein U6151_10580 [Chromobacterium subtsugae]